MFNAFNDIERLHNDLKCFMLSNVLKASMSLYIWLSSSSGRGRSIEDQLLDLDLMTNSNSQSTFMWTVVSICIDFNIVRVGHPTASTLTDFQYLSTSGAEDFLAACFVR